MGYNHDNFLKVQSDYLKMSEENETEASTKRKMLQNRFPRIAEIDKEFEQSGMTLMQLALQYQGEAYDIKAKEFGEHYKSLKQERANILISNGFPADFSDIHYNCEKCKDTGYIGIKMCPCMKQALIKEGMKSCGLGSLIDTQSFESFDLSYYDDSSRPTMNSAFENAKSIAENIIKGNNNNVLLIGQTGLGKTHLSTAIAKECLNNAVDVFYNSAMGMVADFEAKRFGSSNIESDSDNTDKYLNCDLLVIDDLGTEIVNQFTTSILYYVLSYRINNKKSTIINTNLTGFTDIKNLYGDRIFSRIMGEFKIIQFAGNDIRLQKILKSHK